MSKGLQLYFLGNLERRIEFGFEITRSTFYFRMPEQELGCFEVPGCCTINNTLVRRSDCVPYTSGSSPAPSTQSQTRREYCRPERCDLEWTRLGNIYFCRIGEPRRDNHSVIAALVSVMISNCNGLPVRCNTTRPRWRTRCGYQTSLTCRQTRSRPGNLLSSARLNSARSRTRPSARNLSRISQTSCGRNARFWPTLRPLFHGGTLLPPGCAIWL